MMNKLKVGCMLYNMQPIYFMKGEYYDYTGYKDKGIKWRYQCCL